jgi:hypothetical protein
MPPALQTFNIKLGKFSVLADIKLPRLDKLTQQDVEDYGQELVDFSRRAALEALGPEMRALQQQNQALQARLRQQTRQDLEQQLDQSVPGWRRAYSDPAWREWLDALDDYSGRSRRELINHAAEAGDAVRVAAFFRQPAAQHGPAGSYRSRPAATGGPCIYTRAQIANLYERRRKGEINDANWARWEAEIFAAANQGRIAGALDRDGNKLTELR